MDPAIHSTNSTRRFGGKDEDYLDIHEFMDSSKAAFPTNAHRIFTHNSWFVAMVIPKVFGRRRQNSDGKWYNTKDVAEFHVLEDFRMKFIPTPQDYLEDMGIPGWVNNALGTPSRLLRDKTTVYNNNKTTEDGHIIKD